MSKKKADGARLLIPNSLTPTLYVGIDTGVKTGIAVWTPAEKCLQVVTTPIHHAMQMVKQILMNGEQVLVRVEDARQRTWFGKEDAGDRFGAKRQGAGSIKRDASIWNDYLIDLADAYPNQLGFEMVAPKHNKTKLSEQQFAAYTGYKGRTSEHGRDAAMLVYGYGLNQVKQLTL